MVQLKLLKKGLKRTDGHAEEILISGPFPTVICSMSEVECFADLFSRLTPFLSYKISNAINDSSD